MAKDKAAAIAATRARLDRAKGVYFVDHTGLTVADVEALRHQCRLVGVEYLVVKNTLARRALAEVGHAVDPAYLRQPTAMAFAYEDAVTPAKILVEFAKAHEKPRMKGALVDGQMYPAAAMERLAKVPPKAVLLGQLVGGLSGPLSGLVGVLQGTLRKLIGTLAALEEQQRSQEQSQT